MENWLIQRKRVTNKQTMKEDKLPGEVKRVAVLAGRTFEWNGVKYIGPYRAASGSPEITAYSEFEVDQAEAYELFTLPKPTIRVVQGGMFSITRMHDGYHQLEPWAWPGKANGFSTSDRFVKVQFLKDTDWWLCKAGDKRKLRLSIVREFPYRYIDSAEPGPNCTPRPEEPRILICEPRPRRPSDDDMASQEIAEARRNAINGPSWMSGTAKLYPDLQS